MFTRQEYLEYFESVEIQERTMVYRLYNFLPKVKEPYLVSAFEGILGDEIGHYAYLKKMLNKLFRNHEEDRRWEREHTFGLVEVKDNETNQIHSLYIVDSSEGGMCLEGEVGLKIDTRVHVLGETFSKDKHFNKNATVVWSRKILSEHYICGVRFE